MPPAIGAIGALAGAAAGASGALGAIATAVSVGATIAGTALQLAGGKTARKIGMGLTAAGGVVAAGSALSSAYSGKATSATDPQVTGSVGGGAGLMQRDAQSGILARGSRGIANQAKNNNVTNNIANQLWDSNTVKNSQNSNFLGKSQNLINNLGNKVDELNTPENRNTLANVAGSVGDLYANTRYIQASEDIADDKIDFEQREIDRSVAAVNDTDNTQTYIPRFNRRRTGLLRRG